MSSTMSNQEIAAAIFDHVPEDDGDDVLSYRLCIDYDDSERGPNMSAAYDFQMVAGNPVLTGVSFGDREFLNPKDLEALRLETEGDVAAEFPGVSPFWTFVHDRLVIPLLGVVVRLEEWTERKAGWPE